MNHNWRLTRRNDPRDIHPLGAVDLWKPRCHGHHTCQQRVVKTVRTEMPGIGYSEQHWCVDHQQIWEWNQTVRRRRNKRKMDA